MNNKKLLLVLLVALILLCCLLLTACMTKEEFNYYILDDGTCMISQYNGKKTKVIIPSEIGGRTVTGLGYGAFAVIDGDENANIHKAITDIIIPDSVTSIGLNTFSGCSSLTNITIPDAIVSIGPEAFYGCDNLAFNVKDNVKYLGNEKNKNVVAMGVISKDVEDIKLADTCKVIFSRAFADCNNLKKINFSNAERSIGKQAFLNCSQLNELVIPDSVLHLDVDILSGCSKLESLSSPFLGQKEMEDASYCPVLGYLFGQTPYNGGVATRQDFNGGEVDYYIPACLNTVSITGGKRVGVGAFENCTNIVSVILSDTIEEIQESAFWGCTSLKNVKFSNRLEKIGLSAFAGCTSITNLTLPNSLKEIGGGAFSSCKSLSEIIIPNSVTTIGESAFIWCQALKNVTLSDSIVTIGEGVFSVCGSLVYNEKDNVRYLGSSTNAYLMAMGVVDKNQSEIVIDNNCKFIHKEAFLLAGFTSASISENVVFIDSRAFAGTRVTTLTIPDSVKNICGDAFYGCEDLTQLILGSGIKRIGAYSVDHCSKLEGIFYKGTKEDREQIDFTYQNEDILGKTWYYYSEEPPADTTNNYWHYVDGVVTIW